MREETYVLDTGDEVMVQFDGDTNKVIDLYAYTDKSFHLDEVIEHWHTGKNPAFIHASNPQEAWWDIQDMLLVGEQ